MTFSRMNSGFLLVKPERILASRNLSLRLSGRIERRKAVSTFSVR